MTGLSGVFEGFVHPRAQRDPVLAGIHRNYIAARFAAGCLALLAFPVYLALAGSTHPAIVGVFALIIAPVISTFVLAKTGHLGVASFVSAGVFAGLVYATALSSGGIGSPFVVWVLVAPLEAALSRDRRSVFAAGGCGALALGLLTIQPGLDVAALSSAYGDAPWMVLIIVGSAMLYAAASVMLVWSRETELESVFATDTMRHRLLAENATDVVSRHDAEGRARYVSPAAQRLLGLCGEALTGNRWADRIHPADQRSFLLGITRAETRGSEVSCEFRMRRQREVAAELRDYASEDEYVWVEMRCRRTRLEEQLDGDIVAATRDITARKEQEAALELSREDAERASQAKTRFLANVSHELRTPLNAIIGFSDLLKTGVHGPIGHPRNAEYVDLINESGYHLLELVNELLDMSRIESGRFAIQREPFDVHDLLTSCAALMSAEALRNHIQIVVHAPEDAPELNADRRACKQMLFNLLSNALKFTPEGGRVDLTAAFELDRVVLTVRDTGVGISPEDLPRLGRPFVQADTSYSRTHEGTGLGLSVVNGLAELHDGTLQIESELGLGTSVTIHLPNIREAASVARPAPPSLSLPKTDTVQRLTGTG